MLTEQSASVFLVFAGVVLVLGSLFGLFLIRQLIYRIIETNDDRQKKNSYELNGSDFEKEVERLLNGSKTALKNAHRPTSLSVNRRSFGDFGGDLIVDYWAKRCVVQCKKHNKPETHSSIAAIYQASYAQAFYDADYAIAFTNTDFSDPAKTAAKTLGIILLNGETYKALQDGNDEKINEDIRVLRYTAVLCPRCILRIIRFFRRRRFRFKHYKKKYASSAYKEDHRFVNEVKSLCRWLKNKTINRRESQERTIRKT